MSVALLLLCLSLTGQEPPAGVPEPPRSSALPADYLLGAGDVVSIRVSGVREFDQSVRIANSGRVHVPYVGILMVAGMTPLELERDIATKLKEHHLITNPSVSVQVTEHRARPTYVIGQVGAPGQFMVTGEMYLLELLSKAGGLLSSAGDIGYLYRRNSLQPEVQVRLNRGDEAGPPSEPARARSAGTAEEVIEIDLNELRAGTRPELNLRLEGGEVIYIPVRETGTIYVIGDVKVPGAYTLPRRGEITAAQAVIYAGGPLATAKMSNGFVMRHDDAGVRQAMPVDFAAIIAGRQPDFPVKPDDIIFIPSSGAKTVGVALFNMLPRLLQQFLIF